MEKQKNFSTKDNEENEQLIMYTEEMEPIGLINRQFYKKINTVHFNNREVRPWLEGITCFVIDTSDGKIAVERRGKNETNPGMLDAISGHVRPGEITRVTAAREMREEATMQGYNKIEIAENLVFLGKLKADFEKAEKTKDSNMRYFLTFYAFLVDNKEGIKSNEEAVENLKWIDKEDVKNAIRTSMFRFPYTDETKEDFEKIFENLDKAIRGEKIVDVENRLKLYE